MRVLWVCNLIISDFSHEFDVRPTCFGGWMSGMLNKLSESKEICIGLCFPVIDESRMKCGIHGGHPFFSFHASMDTSGYDEDSINEFFDILNTFHPDIVHIWGTEYNHALVAMEACKKYGIIDRTLVSIQGLTSLYAKHYTMGIPFEPWLHLGEPSILEGLKQFKQRGKTEMAVLQSARHVCDSTEWAKNSVRLINKNLNFYYCNDIIRDEFYENAFRWTASSCKRRSIFVSQGHYPIKGLHFLLNALPLIKKFFPDVVLHIAGENILATNSNDGYVHYINNLIQKLELQENIKFLCNLSEKDMVKEYLKANVFLSPSTIENHSNAICESMMIGCPVIASYVGGTPDLIEHGKTGFLYQCDAYYMIAAYVRNLFEDDDLANRISYRGGVEAMQRHDRNENGKKMVNIYKTILNRREE